MPRSIPLSQKYYEILKTGQISFDAKFNPVVDSKMEYEGRHFHKYLEKSTPLTNLYFYVTQKRGINLKRPDLIKAGSAWLEFRKSLQNSVTFCPLPQPLQEQLLDEITEYKANEFWEIKNGKLTRNYLNPYFKKSKVDAESVSNTISDINERIHKRYRMAHSKGTLKFHEKIPYYHNFELLTDPAHKQAYDRYVAGQTPLTVLYFYLNHVFRQSKQPSEARLAIGSIQWKNYFADCVANKEWLPLPPEIKKEIEDQIEPHKQYWMFTRQGFLSRKGLRRTSDKIFRPITSISHKRNSPEEAIDPSKKQRQEIKASQPVALSSSSSSSSSTSLFSFQGIEMVALPPATPIADADNAYAPFTFFAADNFPDAATSSSAPSFELPAPATHNAAPDVPFTFFAADNFPDAATSLSAPSIELDTPGTPDAAPSVDAHCNYPVYMRLYVPGLSSSMGLFARPNAAPLVFTPPDAAPILPDASSSIRSY